MKVLKLFDLLLQLPFIVIFNFWVLPFKQAVHLPIFIFSRNWYVTYLSILKGGKIIIDSHNIRFRMIKLGSRDYFYEKVGLYLKCEGTIIFRGSCVITNGSIIDVKRIAILEFGDNVGISIIKLICKKNIIIGNDTLIGINCMIMDSDFHSIIDLDGKRYVNPSKKIRIGNNNWIGYGTTILKGAYTPDNCIVRAKSILDRKYNVSQYAILGTNFKTDCIGERYLHNPFNDDIDVNGCNRITDNEIDLLFELFNYNRDKSILS